MKQSIPQMKALAAGMGISLHELIRRRFLRQNVEAVADENGTIRFRTPAPVRIKRDLGGWMPRAKTLVLTSEIK